MLAAMEAAQAAASVASNDPRVDESKTPQLKTEERSSPSVAERRREEIMLAATAEAAVSVASNDPRVDPLAAMADENAAASVASDDDAAAEAAELRGEAAKLRATVEALRRAEPREARQTHERESDEDNPGW